MILNKALKRAIGVGAVLLVIFAWSGAAAAYFPLHPTVAQWAAILTVAAVATEAAIWIGASLLGISALQRFSLFMGSRQSAGAGMNRGRPRAQGPAGTDFARA